MTKNTQVVEGWTGPGRRDSVIIPLDLSEDGMRMKMGQSGIYEWWYFDAHLDSGHTLVVFFHASNPNPGRVGKTGVETILIRPDGERVERFTAYRRARLSAAPDSPDVAIGPNRLRVKKQTGGLPVYEVVVEEDDLRCHLVYQAQIEGWKPGTGLSQFGDLGYFGWVVPFARGSVHGTIIDAGRTIEVSGIGYHDHNWLNFSFPRMIRYWMWGRIYSERYTVAFAYIQCNERMENHTVKVLMLAEEEKVILSTGEFDLTMEDLEFAPEAGHRFPRRTCIHAPGALSATLNVSNVLEAHDMLDNYHPLIRFVAKNILRIRPGYFRLNSDFELCVTREKGAITDSGAMLHELVLFQPVAKRPA